VGKGSGFRKGRDQAAYEDGWERIYGQKSKQQTTGSAAEGAGQVDEDSTSSSAEAVDSETTEGSERSHEREAG
jgi:hypothetical protein